MHAVAAPQPVLSAPLSALRPRYDVVVVGSGYGGGVAASRLARAGRSVCVLERGKEYLPGDFPGDEAAARSETQVHVAGLGRHIGSRLALFDFHVDDDVSVLRGCGLGGTSLINSAVAVEPDPDLFEDPAWPQALRDDLASVREGFARAREVLEPRTYPQGWPALAKQAALKRSAEAMGGPLVTPAAHDHGSPVRARRPLRVGPPELHPLRTSDGEQLLLTRYRGGGKGPVLLTHGLGVSSRIFSLDTVDENLVEHLVAAGYDTWLLDYRSSVDLGGAARAHDADSIATIDLPLAVDEVRRVTRADSVQVVAHCFGATVFYMSMLSGRLHGVRSAVTSQATPHLVGTPMVRLKAGLHLPGLLGALGVRDMDACADATRGPLARVYDRALSRWPVTPGNHCRSATCRRITFLYAELFEHARLNRATHDTLHELFGLANIPAFRHLAGLVRGGRLVDARGGDVYMPHPERLAIPIRMIHGEKNACFDPIGSAQSLAWLCRHNDPALYSRVVVPGYGHIDCVLGERASRDVYPNILSHLEATR